MNKGEHLVAAGETNVKEDRDCGRFGETPLQVSTFTKRFGIGGDFIMAPLPGHEVTGSGCWWLAKER